jgi:hypothetical protein
VKSSPNTGSPTLIHGSPEAHDSIVLLPYFAFDSTSQVKQKDYSTERALRILVGKRRRLLDYLIDTISKDMFHYQGTGDQKIIFSKKDEKRMEQLFFILFFCYESFP